MLTQSKIEEFAIPPLALSSSKFPTPFPIPSVPSTARGGINTSRLQEFMSPSRIAMIPTWFESKQHQLESIAAENSFVYSAKDWADKIKESFSIPTTSYSSFSPSHAGFSSASPVHNLFHKEQVSNSQATNSMSQIKPSFSSPFNDFNRSSSHYSQANRKVDFSSPFREMPGAHLLPISQAGKRTLDTSPILMKNETSGLFNPYKGTTAAEMLTSTMSKKPLRIHASSGESTSPLGGRSAVRIAPVPMPGSPQALDLLRKDFKSNLMKLSDISGLGNTHNFNKLNANKNFLNNVREDKNDQEGYVRSYPRGDPLYEPLSASTTSSHRFKNVSEPDRPYRENNPNFGYERENKNGFDNRDEFHLNPNKKGQNSYFRENTYGNDEELHYRRENIHSKMNLRAPSANPALEDYGDTQSETPLADRLTKLLGLPPPSQGGSEYEDDEGTYRSYHY